MSLYNDAQKAQLASRWIDAYNAYYLFLETQYCRGRTRTRDVVSELLSSPELLSALNETLTEQYTPKALRHLHYANTSSWLKDPRLLITEIVQLRGQLRHHSLGNPRRWDPNNQQDYQAEAIFLGMVAQAIAFPKTVDISWRPEFLSQFLELANEMKQTVEVIVVLTVRETEHIEDISLKMSFPQPEPDVSLAKAVLQKALEIFEQRSPGGELFALRAWVKNTRAELFRYDVGPSLNR